MPLKILEGPTGGILMSLIECDFCYIERSFWLKAFTFLNCKLVIHLTWDKLSRNACRKYLSSMWAKPTTFRFVQILGTCVHLFSNYRDTSFISGHHGKCNATQLSHIRSLKSEIKKIVLNVNLQMCCALPLHPSVEFANHDSSFFLSLFLILISLGSAPDIWTRPLGLETWIGGGVPAPGQWSRSCRGPSTGGETLEWAMADRKPSTGGQTRGSAAAWGWRRTQAAPGVSVLIFLLLPHGRGYFTSPPPSWLSRL